MESLANHFSTSDFLLFKSLQGISSTLRDNQKREITYTIGRSMGVKMGSAFLSDMPAFEEFKSRASQIMENLVLGVVERVDIQIPFFRETRFVLYISSCNTGENANTPAEGHNADERGDLSLCYFKAGLFSGIMKYYLKRENVAKEIYCGERGNGICQFEIVVP